MAYIPKGPKFYGGGPIPGGKTALPGGKYLDGIKIIGLETVIPKSTAPKGGTVIIAQVSLPGLDPAKGSLITADKKLPGLGAGLPPVDVYTPGAPVGAPPKRGPKTPKKDEPDSEE